MTVARDRRLVTTREAAEILGLAQQTLTNWRSTGLEGPPFVKLGRAVRYNLDDLDQWLSEQTCHPDPAFSR